MRSIDAKCLAHCVGDVGLLSARFCGIKVVPASAQQLNCYKLFQVRSNNVGFCELARVRGKGVKTGGYISNQQIPFEQFSFEL